MDDWNESFLKKGDLQKKIINASENVEPKSWPLTTRKAGAFLIPLIDYPTHIGIIIRKSSFDLSSQIYLPGGDDPLVSPRAAMLDKASEEMGIDQKNIHILGYLCMYPLKDVEYDAHIFVGWTPPMEEWQLDAENINKAFKIPLEYFVEEFNSPQYDLKKPEFSFQLGEEGDSELALSDSTARIMSILIRRLVIPA